jgi:hypothetical protein
MAWSDEFWKPIKLKDGRTLATLGDAREFISTLPPLSQTDESAQGSGRRQRRGGSHVIRPGDAMVLREFLDRPRSEPLRIIYLDSRGGRTIVALRMAKMIHDQGLDTAFHVGRAHCASECTTLFAGGIHRYYIGGANVRDGIGTRYGLGFHPSSGGQQLEDRVNEFYDQVGVPGAAQLRYRLYPRETVNPMLGHRDMFFAAPRLRQASLPAYRNRTIRA